MKRLAFALLIWALLLSPTPKKQDMVQCKDCGVQNDPARGSKRCRNCGAWL